MPGRRKKYIGKKPHRMLVISWDAVGNQDLAALETLPHLRSLMERAACCRRVKSVCPSLTYPAHAAIVTGRNPSHTGIVNNIRFQPFRKEPDWFWQRRFIRGTTLYDQAEEAGLRTAALLWPVTAGAKITWNMPEIWARRFWQNQITESLFNGSIGYQIDLYRRFGRLLEGTKQPMLDNFVQASLLWTLSYYRPDLTLVHYTDVDAMRHQYGVDSREAQAALRRLDMRLGAVMGLLERQMELRNTNIILLGDHYQKNVNCVLYPNYHMVKNGWAKERGGRIVWWQAAANNCDGACYIYLKNREDGELKLAVANWLKELKQTPGSGIKEVYTGKRAREKGADPRCSFMLEAREGFYFKNGCRVEREEYRPGSKVHRGAHGYDPDCPGYETFFMAAGPDFQPGAEVAAMNLTDEGPTMARALGLELVDADGAVIDSFFRFAY